MKKNQKKHKIQVILIVVALILGSIFVINKIASGETYASAVAICPAGNPNCSGGTNVEVIIEAATCSATGKKKTVCSGCNMIIGEIVTLAKNPNNHVNLKYDSDGNGHHSVTCKDCDKAIAGAAPCNLITTSETSATCVDEGSITKICSLCKYKTETVLPATGEHDWTDWFFENDEKKPTCQSGGVEMRTCFNCPTYEERDVGKVSHHNYVYKFISNGTHAQKCEWCEVTLEGSEETCTYENGKCTKCGAAQPTTPGGDPNPGGDPDPDPGDGGDTKPELSGITTYKVNDKNMTNVKIATKASELIKTIQDANEGATVTIFNSNNETVSEDETLATGMRIEVTIGDTKYDITIVIKGDTDGNGKAELLDIIKMNKHRLNKLQLEDAYFQAADVNGDGKVDLLDIIKLNKFRLNKITEL